jgi:ABC-type Mn2+/Zn2+ transport system permease subunit
MFVAVLATLVMVMAVALYDSQRQTSHDQVWAFVFSGAVVPALGRVLIRLARGNEDVRLK